MKKRVRAVILSPAVTTLISRPEQLVSPGPFSFNAEMDKNSSQLPSQNPSRTFKYRFTMADFARSWLELKESEIPFATLSLPSHKLTEHFEGNGEFSRWLEVSGSNGCFVVKSSIQLVSDGLENVAHGRDNGTVGCERFIEVFLVNGNNVEELWTKGSFQSQLLKGKEDIVSLGFRADKFLAKVVKMPNWLLRISLRIELGVTPDAPLRSTGGMYPVMKASEPPFLASLTSKDFADVTIECNGRTFPVHKLILSCASTVFARMLESSMIEVSSKRVKIDDIDASTIAFMLEFIYTGNFTELPDDDAILDLLYCAEKYDLAGLKAAALLHMVSTVSDFNVIKFLNAAMVFNVEREFTNKFLQHFKTNWDSLSTSTEFKEFFRGHFDEFFGDRRCTNCIMKQDMTASNERLWPFHPEDERAVRTPTMASTPFAHSIGMRKFQF